MAIETILFTPEDSLGLIKKSFRKKLMTGGAVLVLPEELSDAEQLKLFEVTLEESGKPGVAREALVALARHPKLVSKIATLLANLKLATISRELFKRNDLDQETARLVAETGGIRNIERRALESKRIDSLAENELRSFLLENIGEEHQAVEARLSLFSAKNLPNDLLFLLKRDPSSKVRFRARSTPLSKEP